MARSGRQPERAAFWLPSLVSGFGPFLAGVLMARLTGTDWRGERVPGARWRWGLLAVLVPPALCVLAFAVAAILPAVELARDPVSGKEGGLGRWVPFLAPERLGSGLVLSFLAGPTLLTLLAIGEEVGWRGYLYRRLAPLGFWRSAFLIGAVWGPWHAPNHYVAGALSPIPIPLPNLLPFTVSTVLLSALLCYFRRRSGSVLVAAHFHGCVNGNAWIANVSFHAPAGAVGLLGLAGMPVLLAGILAMRSLDSSLGGSRGRDRDGAAGAPPAEGPRPSVELPPGERESSGQEPALPGG